MSTTGTTIYTVLGTTDEENTCQLCGREDLKSTVGLRENLTGAVVYFGSDCAARASGWTAKEVEAQARTADEAAAAELARFAAERSAAESSRWEAFLAEQTGITGDTFAAIVALGGFAQARAAYRAAVA